MLQLQTPEFKTSWDYFVVIKYDIKFRKCKYLQIVKQNTSAIIAYTIVNLSEDKLRPNSVEFAAGYLKCLALM